MVRSRTVLIALAVAAMPVVTLATGASVPLNSFVEVRSETYRHEKPDFSLQYPYELHTTAPSRKGEVFSAAGSERTPALNVMVLSRPPDLTLEQAAQAAAKQLAPNGTIKAQQPIDLGGVPGEQVTLDWSVPIGMGVDLRSMQVSAFHGDTWVIVTVTDGRVGDAVAPQLAEAVGSLRFNP
jgi:hypothetical protein